MLELGRVSQSGFYRFDEDAKPALRTDLDLWDAIQRMGGLRSVVAESALVRHQLLVLNRGDEAIRFPTLL